MKQLVLVGLLGLGFGLPDAAAQQVIPSLKKEFLDSTWHVLASAAGARYRRETEYTDSTAGVVRDYFLSNGQLQSRGTYENIRKKVAHGISETWYVNGQLESHAEFSHGKPSGDYSLYYSGGQTQSRIRYLNGALDDSKCFTVTGEPMECPVVVETMPVYSEGDGSAQAVVEAVRRNFHYPRSARRANITGRVIISFEVDIQGNVASAYIEEGLAPTIDAAALQAV